MRGHLRRYVGVGQNKDVQLFYFFAKSQKDPLKDPLLLWIDGCPGCSVIASFPFASGNFKVAGPVGVLALCSG
ncbi:hypothetical protein Ddye_021178 [Dipteronia dyeriana]|uniref:Uncharacterized protein n=1 Tax=Dipteronia dyeriana TaxID=168575 RepID=A0AAD9U1Y2_9ROSI|nr:hypothetical protein Ddye_021178 [Dipteronia dyeriana]